VNGTGKTLGSVEPEVEPLESIGVGVLPDSQSNILVALGINNLDITTIKI
jgi:hypothetical protein